FTSGLVAWRRYLFARPFTLALRGLFFGRYGRDADLFQQFLGSTELIRGYTAGSIIDHECLQFGTQTSCPELDQLIGSSLAVVNAELRFPLTRSLVLGFLPVGLPPIEGAIFYDAGLAWNSNSKIILHRSTNHRPSKRLVRQPEAPPAPPGSPSASRPREEPRGCTGSPPWSRSPPQFAASSPRSPA